MTDLHALAGRYNSLAVHLTRRLRRTDSETGVGPARLSALSVLVFGGPCTLSELAAAEQVSAPTMSRVVRALKVSGLVTRSPHPTDRRASILTASEAGMTLMERGRQRRIQQLAERLARLDDAGIATLVAAADTLEELERIDHQ